MSKLPRIYVAVRGSVLHVIDDNAYGGKTPTPDDVENDWQAIKKDIRTFSSWDELLDSLTAPHEIITESGLGLRA